MSDIEQNNQISTFDEFDLPDGGRVPVMLVMQPATAESPKPAGPLPEPLRIWPPPWWLWGFAGIEATQSTQFFLINGQGSGAGGNNSVPLVAQKELILRVYPRSGILLGSPMQVTGIVSRAGKPNLTPINGPVPVQSVSAIQRINANHSLNFRVPAADCVGTVTFTVKLIDTSNAANYRTQNMTLNFESVARMRVHGVLIHYTGNDATGHPTDIAAPTGIDLINTLAWVGRTYPISGFNYTACQVIDFNGDLTAGGGGGCGTGWNQLSNTLWNMRAASTPDASGNRDVFIGLLPNGTPTSGVIGCGGGGVAIAYNGGGSVLAQEVGHGFGRAHAPCGNPGGPDPNYPAYNSYPSASIGEFGVDTSSMQIFNPASTYDFMSYCGPVWVSPYTYTGLKNSIVSGLGGAPAHPGRAGSRASAGEHLFLNFRMNRSGKVELLKSFHVYTGAPPVEMGEPTKVGCDLLAEDGEVLYSHRCRVVDPHMDDDGLYPDFHEAIRLEDDWKDKVRSIAFTREGKVTHKYEAEAPAPEVEFTGTKHVERPAELIRLEWSAKQTARGKLSQHPVHYILRYSNNGGKTWHPVIADLTDNHYVVNLNLLPGGDKCVFQVIASSGIRSSIATTQPMQVPRKPRKAYILSPANSGMTFKRGENVLLLGGGFSPEFETTDFDEVVWTSDRDGVIGTGYQVIAHSLSAGRHRINIALPDGLDGEASASVFFTIE